MNNFLKIAHEHGVKQALQKCGYASIAEVEKDIKDLGLIEGDKTAAAAPSNDVFAMLKSKLG